MKYPLICMAIAISAVGCSSDESKTDENPFFTDYDTPLQAPPFNEIKVEHFRPAFDEGIRMQKQEIDSIVKNSEPPSFENTVAALEYSGQLLTKVSSVFSP